MRRKRKIGIIRGMQGSYGSGIAILILADPRGGRVSHVPCDNGPTVRALDAAFGGVIGHDHTIRPGAVIGREIAYRTDECGLLYDFEPAEVEA